MKIATCRLALVWIVVAIVSLLQSRPAFAQLFFPPPAGWVTEPAPTPIPRPGELAVVAPSPAPEPILGASFNYAERSENIRVTVPSFGSFAGKSNTSLYAGGIDAYVLGCSLASTIECNPPNRQIPGAGRLAADLGGFAGYADGSATIAGQKVNLHGPALGASASLYLQSPGVKVRFGEGWTNLSLFFLGGAQYTATEFSALSGWTNTYLVKPRGGFVFETWKEETLSLYGGASWETFTKRQTLESSGLTFNVKPKNAWSPLVGAAYQNILGTGDLKGFSLTAEGEVGDRTGAVVSLRYAFGPRM